MNSSNQKSVYQMIGESERPYLIYVDGETMEVITDADVDDMRECINSLKASLATVTVERDRMAEDARRYRWLRDNGALLAGEVGYPKRNKWLDAAIDDAIAYAKVKSG